MTHDRTPCEETGAAAHGCLFVVATPLGNLEDITLRALRVLREADLIAAEDTRHTRKLLAHFDIHTPFTSFHSHRQHRQAPHLVERILAGARVALVTDAGTPGISDPGAVLVRAAVDAGIEVVPVPGPAALVALLSVSGLATDSFVFEGFLPIKEGRKRRVVAGLAAEERTLVFYESPHRLVKTLGVLRDVLGDRRASVGRELTKKFEEVRRGTIGELLAHFGSREVRGEITLAVEGTRGKPARATGRGEEPTGGDEGA